MYSSTFGCAGSLLLASFSLAVMSGGCVVAAGLLDLGARCPWTWLHRWGVPKSHRPGVHLLNSGTRSSWLALWAGSCRMAPVCWWVLKPPATTGYSLDPKWGLLVLASTWMNRLLKTASANVLVPRQNNQLPPNSLQVFPRSASGADPGFFPANCLHTETGNMWEFACGAESLFSTVWLALSKSAKLVCKPDEFQWLISLMKHPQDGEPEAALRPLASFGRTSVIGMILPSVGCRPKGVNPYCTVPPPLLNIWLWLLFIFSYEKINFSASL